MIMRRLACLVLVSAFALACTSGDRDDVSSDQHEINVVTPPPAGAQQDVPLPGSEPIPASATGAPLPAPPIDPLLLTRQQDYLDALSSERAAGIAADLSPATRASNESALKLDVMGE